MASYLDAVAAESLREAIGWACASMISWVTRAGGVELAATTRSAFEARYGARPRKPNPHLIDAYARSVPAFPWVRATDRGVRSDDASPFLP